MDNWERVRDHLGSSAIVIEHLDLAREPARIAQGLASLLSLDGHEEDRLRDVLTVARPERSSDDFAAVRSLDGLAWTAEQIALFRSVCGPAMRRSGLRRDGGLFRAGRTPLIGTAAVAEANSSDLVPSAEQQHQQDEEDQAAASRGHEQRHHRLAGNEGEAPGDQGAGCGDGREDQQAKPPQAPQQGICEALA